MSHSPKHVPSTRELAAYLEGELMASEMRRVEAQLEESLDARRRLHQLVTIREALASPIHPLETLDLSGAVMRSIESGDSRSHQRHRRWWACAGVAAACFVFMISQRAGVDSEFRTKSAGQDLTLSTGSASARAYVVAPGDSPVPLLGSLPTRSSLMLSYLNPGPAPYSYAMMFAVDSAGQVLWFYPAFETRDTDPHSISIEPSTKPQMLPDVITHDMAVGPVAIYALFSRQHVAVSEVEKWIQQGVLNPSQPPRPDTLLAVTRVQVVP